MKPNSKKFFDTNGFAIIRGEFVKEINEIQKELLEYLNFHAKKNGLIDKKVSNYDLLVKKLMKPKTKLRTFIYDSVPLLPTVQALNHNPKLKKILKSLGYKIPISSDIANIRFDIRKKNEVKFLRGVHQDVRSIKSKKTVTIWIPLTKVDYQNGTVAMYPKTQNKGLYKHSYNPNLLVPEKYLPRSFDKMERNKFIIDANPGDVAIFNCFTLHRSEVSKVDRIRSCVQLTYTDLSELNHKDGLFFLSKDFKAFARKDKSLNSTLK